MLAVTPHVPRDPGLDVLTGTDAHGILAAALKPADAELLDWTVRDVDCRPGDRTTASYIAKVAWPHGVRHETLAATVSATGARSTSASQVVVGDTPLVITDGAQQVHVWRFPFDPELPALAAACFPGSAAQILRDLGIECAEPELRVRSYRPRKRAVIEVHTPTIRLFLKVLRPKSAASIRERHLLLTSAGVPVPECLGWSDNGLMALAEVPGLPLGPALDELTERACHPENLLTLLDDLPDNVCAFPRRQPWSRQARHYAGVIGAALPSAAGSAHAVADSVDARLASYDDADDEATHGDFYESQLMVRDGQVSGLLDIDGLGPGRRADDLACLLAHLSVRASMSPRSARRIRRVVEHWLPVFEQRVCPHELRTRTAGVLVSLATGPFRAQQPKWQEATETRLTLATQWLRSADQT